MEFIDGVGLDRIISQRRGGCRSSARPRSARRWRTRSTTPTAIEVVHRDIKPANIMIEAGDRVKVTDFGIAKPGDSAEHLTVTGQPARHAVLHEPGAGARPETRRAQRPVLARLRALRDGRRPQGVPRRLRSPSCCSRSSPRSRSRCSELEPSVPEPLVRLIQKALAKSPDARFQTGREMAEQLLALTRPGAMPTLRAIDTPTIAAASTSSPTIASAPTLARRADRRLAGHAAAGRQPDAAGQRSRAARADDPHTRHGHRSAARRRHRGPPRRGRPSPPRAPAKSGSGPRPGARPRGRRRARCSSPSPAAAGGSSCTASRPSPSWRRRRSPSRPCPRRSLPRRRRRPLRRRPRACRPRPRPLPPPRRSPPRRSRPTSPRRRSRPAADAVSPRRASRRSPAPPCRTPVPRRSSRRAATSAS